MAATGFRMRLAQASDASDIRNIYAPFITDSSVSFEYEIPSVSDMENRILTTLTTYPWLVIEQNGLVVAYAYAGLHRARKAYQWSVETSVYIHHEYRKHKLATRIYTALLQLLEAQGYRNAFAGMTLPNPASEGFHTKMGFVPIGTYRDVGNKFGEWHSTMWMQLQLGKKTNEAPDDPVPLPDWLSNENNRQWLETLFADVR